MHYACCLLVEVQGIYGEKRRVLTELNVVIALAFRTVVEYFYLSF